MTYTFQDLKPRQDFLTDEYDIHNQRWLNLPTGKTWLKTSLDFYSSGKRAMDILLKASIGLDAPLKNLRISDDTCAVLTGQITAALIEVDTPAKKRNGKDHLVAIDSIFFDHVSLPTPLNASYPPPIYYASYALHWLDQALVSFNDKANSLAADYVSIASQLVGRAEAYTSSENALGITKKDLADERDMAATSRKAVVAKGGGKAKREVFDVVRRITTRVYKDRKDLHKKTIAIAADSILPYVREECKKRFPKSNYSSPIPGIGLVKEVISKVRNETKE